MAELCLKEMILVASITDPPPRESKIGDAVVAVARTLDRTVERAFSMSSKGACCLMDGIVPVWWLPRRVSSCGMSSVLFNELVLMINTCEEGGRQERRFCATQPLP